MASTSSEKEAGALEGFGTRWWRMVAGSDTWLLAAAIAIGVLTACACVAFHWAVDGAHELFWKSLGGALALQDLDDETVAERGIRGAQAANGLVYRLLFIWAAVIAAMTLYGWSE